MRKVINFNGEWTFRAGFDAGPELRERFAGIGMAVDAVHGPEAFAARLRRDWATFRPVIEQLGIRAE